jgi:hypothetical protein
MNVDRMIEEFNAARVDYLLIGGMNFLLRHLPELTFDVDFWVEDSPENLLRLNAALRALGASWGPTEELWKPVPETSDWLRRQTVYCLTTQFGAVDIFREVRGLEGRYAECKCAAVHAQTASGVPYSGLSDQHMLDTQLALEENDRKPNRIAVLKRALGQND